MRAAQPGVPPCETLWWPSRACVRARVRHRRTEMRECSCPRYGVPSAETQRCADVGIYFFSGLYYYLYLGVSVMNTASYLYPYTQIGVSNMSAYSEQKTQSWTIHDYIEEMIYIAEVIEVPGMQARMAEIKNAVTKKFTAEEREAAGLLF